MTAEFDRLAGQVATNIQKLVNNVSSMQRMVQHVDTQGGSIEISPNQFLRDFLDFTFANKY